MTAAARRVWHRLEGRKALEVEEQMPIDLSVKTDRHTVYVQNDCTGRLGHWQTLMTVKTIIWLPLQLFKLLRLVIITGNWLPSLPLIANERGNVASDWQEEEQEALFKSEQTQSSKSRRPWSIPIDHWSKQLRWSVNESECDSISFCLFSVSTVRLIRAAYIFSMVMFSRTPQAPDNKPKTQSVLSDYSMMNYKCRTLAIIDNAIYRHNIIT